MKTKIYTIEGKQGKEIELPKAFSSSVRKDLVFKIIESKKIEHPYAPSPIAGNQYSASGKLIHRRHVWKSQYGRGMSRIPRKQMSRKGNQFNWVGATIPSTRGGRRAHPPKIASRISTLKINKKELLFGFKSALAATTQEKYLKKRYSTLEKVKIKSLPFIIESKLISLKTKDLLKSLKNILGNSLYMLALKNKKIRKGIGKMRGRKYKKNAGLLLVIGNKEKLKISAFDVQRVQSLGIMHLTKGNLGRLTAYTEEAIKELGEKLK